MVLRLNLRLLDPSCCAQPLVHDSASCLEEDPLYPQEATAWHEQKNPHEVRPQRTDRTHEALFTSIHLNGLDILVIVFSLLITREFDNGTSATTNVAHLGGIRLSYPFLELFKLMYMIFQANLGLFRLEGFPIRNPLRFFHRMSLRFLKLSFQLSYKFRVGLGRLGFGLNPMFTVDSSTPTVLSKSMTCCTTTGSPNGLRLPCP